MAKEKGSKKRNIRNKLNKTFPGSEPNTNASGSADANGMPLDRIRYLEAKLILKPERFTSAHSFRKFGKIVKRVARRVGVGFIEDKRARLPPEIREVVFFDTPDFHLYNKAFILRRRISYVNGFPVGDPEIVLKFRHVDEAKATKMDLHPKIAGKYRIKFKAEALPLKDRVGGYRLLYSHNCEFGLSQVPEGRRTSMALLCQGFPALTKLKESDRQKVTAVNGGIVEEVLLPLGQLDFGKGMCGNCNIALWRTRGDHKQLVGEFTFQVKFDRSEDIAKKPRKLGIQFYVSLQHDLKDWLALGVTKTGTVYRLNGNAPQNNE